MISLVALFCTSLTSQPET